MTDDQLPDPKAFFSDRVYNFLKYLVLIILPAIGALYFGIANIWGFPNSQGVNGTINLIATFLGLMLGLSTRQYNRDVKYDGTINVIEKDEKKVLDFNFVDPHAIDGKSEITLKVNKVD